MKASKSNIIALSLEAEHHRAVQHPYLRALRDGKFKNMDFALRDFAGQYGFYSAWFPRYLCAVIAKIEQAHHRYHLLENMAEESGHLSQEELAAIEAIGIKREWIENIPHPDLFRRFQQSMGVDKNQIPGIEVEVWRESFLDLMQYGSAIAAVGAIGLGTEVIVKFIYSDVLAAIERYTNLEPRDYVFFPLHTQVDDEHGEVLMDIAKDMIACDPLMASDLRKGMLKALNLRAAFWDGMMMRAQSLQHSQTKVA